MSRQFPLVERLTLMNGCVHRLPFREMVGVAATAGFDAVSCWPNVWRHALRKGGLDLTGMRSLLDDHGVVLTDCDYCTDWVPAAPSAETPGVAAGRHELFEVCSALGGSTVTAVHDVAGGLVLDRDAEGFAGLCDDAAEHGLRVALEFVPFTTIRDVQTAWSLVELAGRPNGGLVFDTWHHVRSGVSDASIRQVPASRIFTIQVSDGPAHPPDGDLAVEAMTARLLPGAGEMDNVGALRLLADMGVRANLGPELRLPTEARPAAELVEELVAATRSTLEKASRR